MWETFLRRVYHPLREPAQERYFARLRESQWDSPDAIRNRQFDQLQAVLRHAFASVPYYSKLGKAIGFDPKSFRDFADLERLPVLRKAAVRTNKRDLIDRNVGDLIWKRTSGSTGQPLEIAVDRRAMEFKHAVARRANEWSGWRRGQPVAQLWGRPDHLQNGFKGKLRNALVDRAIHLNTLEMTLEPMADFLRRWNRRAPALLFGHAHSLCLLAQFAERSGLTPRPARGIISSAMPLHAWQRTIISEVFQHRVTDRYGCEETSLIAAECERGNMHVAAESVFVEVVEGRVLLTDLVNRAMPLIRYEIGDCAELSEELCPCGRGLPLLKKIAGREADFIRTPDGRTLSGISLTENFILKLPGVAQVQIVQEEIGRIRLNVVPLEGIDKQIVCDASQILSRELFGPAMRLEIEFLREIPVEASGKVRFCISHVGRSFVSESEAA